MDFIDNQNDIAALLDLPDQALHTAFKLAPELGTGNQSGQVQQEHLFVPQFVGDFTGSNPLGKTFGNGGFANAGLANQAGIVLLPAVQNLNHPLRLHIPADDLIQFSFPGTAG